MTSNNLNFKIALSSDQKEEFIRALNEQIKESEIEENDFVITEDTGKSEFKDLYFEPITATAVGLYVLNITAAGVASWVVGKALDRFFKGKKTDDKIVRDPVVVVLMPDGEIESLDPRKVEELYEVLNRIKAIE